MHRRLPLYSVEYRSHKSTLSQVGARADDPAQRNRSRFSSITAFRVRCQHLPLISAAYRTGKMRVRRRFDGCVR